MDAESPQAGERMTPDWVRKSLGEGEELLRAWACDKEGRWFFAGFFGAADERALSTLWSTYPEVACYYEDGREATRSVREKVGL